MKNATFFKSYRPFESIHTNMSETMKGLINSAMENITESHEQFGQALNHTFMYSEGNASMIAEANYPTRDLYFMAVKLARNVFKPQIEIYALQGKVIFAKNHDPKIPLENHPEAVEVLSIVVTGKQGMYHGVSVIEDGKPNEFVWSEINDAQGKAFAI